MFNRNMKKETFCKRFIIQIYLDTHLSTNQKQIYIYIYIYMLNYVYYKCKYRFDCNRIQVLKLCEGTKSNRYEHTLK